MSNLLLDPSPDALDVRILRVDQIFPAADNLRADVGDVTELADSIATVGLLEPLIVTRSDVDGEFTVVAGNRRLAAAQKAGLEQVPAIVRDVDDAARTEIMLIENLQRNDLAPLEEAEGYRRLVVLGLSQQDIATKVGRSQSHVAKRVALLKLPKVALERVAKGSINLEEAFDLTKLADQPQRIERIVKESRRDSWKSISHMVDVEQRQIRIDHKRAPVIAKLKERGIRVIEESRLGYGGKGNAQYLAANEWPHLDERIDVRTHAKLDCHAALVDDIARVKYVCTNPSRHATAKDRKPGKTKVEREKAKKLKAKTEELTAAWVLASARRFEFMRELVTGKIALGIVVEATAAALADPHSMFELIAGERFDDLLGLDAKKNAFKLGAELVQEHGAAKVVLATALSSMDTQLEPYSDGVLPRSDRARGPLEWLQAHGYELSEVEQQVLQSKGRS